MPLDHGTRVFTIKCQDGEIPFSRDHLRYNFGLVADCQYDTGADCIEVPFTTTQLEPLLMFMSTLIIAAQTKEEWQQLLLAADYFQVTTKYQKHLVKEFTLWWQSQGNIVWPKIYPSISECLLKLKDPNYLTRIESRAKKVNAIRNTLQIAQKIYIDTLGPHGMTGPVCDQQINVPGIGATSVNYLSILRRITDEDKLLEAVGPESPLYPLIAD